MVATDTHDYTITGAGKTYKGSILLDPNQTYVNSVEQGSDITVEQDAANTFLTAASTLFGVLKGLDEVHIVVRDSSERTKKAV